MGNILYVVAVILIIGWFVGFFFFELGAAIHALLIIGLVIIVLRIFSGRRAL